MIKSNGHRAAKYLVTIEKSKYGYHVECPALPGCVSQGDSLTEALQNIKDAIRTYLLMIRKEIHTRKTAEVTVAV
jgi:predicted RNase H-like HicB family nuclease